jgi:hypothetical protein
MNLETSLKGLFDAKQKLQTVEGINSLPVMSENMDRLATYTSAVEDELADIEKELEVKEAAEWKKAVSEGKSPSAAETVAKYECAELKGDVKRLTRIVKSSWSLIDVKRSRFNHLTQEGRGQV